MISPAIIAALIYGACGVLAASAFEFLLRSAADVVGINPWIFVAVPALFSALFALMLYQDAQKKVRKIGESVSRAILISLLDWICFSVLASMVWCAGSSGTCVRDTLRVALLISGLVGGGPTILANVIAGVVTGFVIVRPPRKRLGDDEPPQAPPGIAAA